jgi:hypothetical protein
MDNILTVYLASFVDAPDAAENGANLINEAFGNWVRQQYRSGYATHRVLPDL